MDNPGRIYKQMITQTIMVAGLSDLFVNFCPFTLSSPMHSNISFLSRIFEAKKKKTFKSILSHYFGIQHSTICFACLCFYMIMYVLGSSMST